MATTIVYPSLDVSGTGSISTIIATAGTFTGSLTASTLAVTGTSTFSGTAVFLTTAQFLGTVTFSATVRFLAALDVSGTASVGVLNVGTELALTGLKMNVSATAGEAFILAVNSNVAKTSIGMFSSATVSIVGGYFQVYGNNWSVATLRGGGEFTVDTRNAGTGGFNLFTYDGATFTSQLHLNVGGTLSFLGVSFFNASVGVSATASVGTLVVNGTTTLSGAVRTSGSLDVSATASVGALMVSTKAQMSVFPNSYLLATASGATSTQFKLNFSNTAGGFTHYTLVAQGKGNALATNFIIFLYTDGGTTPFMTYATAANATATASEAILVMDITQDILGSGLVIAVPRYQHFVGLTTQIAQTRSATFTVSAINCIGVTMGSTTTTRTMSAASIYLTGFIGAKS